MRRKVIYVLCVTLISIGFVLLGIFFFSDSYLRLWETIKDLGSSIAFYFCEIFEISYKLPETVGGNSAIIPDIPNLPNNASTFMAQAKLYLKRLVSAENFNRWWTVTANKIELWSKVLLLALPCLILLIVLIKKVYEKGNTRHDKDTTPLKMYKWVQKKTYCPLKTL